MFVGKKFVIVDKDGVKILGIKVWGLYVLFMLVYYCGKYWFIIVDNWFLCKDGMLVDMYDKDMLFGIEVYFSVDKVFIGLVFKDNEGWFLFVSFVFGFFKV